MKHLIFKIFIAALLTGAACGQTQKTSSQDIPDESVRKVDPSVVAIQHESAGGSGFVVSPDGYILTNGHVVRGQDEEDPTQPAKSITVILNDEQKFPARVIGFSLNPDVALIKIEPQHPLTPVEFGDSRNVQVGQRCFAVGMPLGLKRTFTRGILSNIDRTDLGTETKVFQTDAAINPGNSGGPLFDLNGRVLGLNTYASQGANNLGFTIPIHVALVLKEHFLKSGRFIRSDLPYYTTSELYTELAKGMGVDKGILVEFVLPGSSAYKAGLRDGDIITETNGQPCTAHTHAELLDYNWELTTRKPGEEITFTILRGPTGSKHPEKITATLEEMELLPKFGLNAGEIVEHRYDALGLGVRQLGVTTRVLYALTDAKGVLISTASETSPAGKADLRALDVITHIAGIPTPTIETFQRELDKQLANHSKAIEVTVARGKATLNTAIAPYYVLRNTKILMVVPAGEREFVDLMQRELIASGAATTVSEPKPGLMAGDFDVVLFTGGASARAFSENPDALRIVKEAEAGKKVIAGVGSSVVVIANGMTNIKDKKLTTTREDSSAIMGKEANYTGKEVESDGKLVTTTGFDRAAVRAFLKALYRAALSDG